MPKERKSIEKLFRLVDVLNGQILKLNKEVKSLQEALSKQDPTTHISGQVSKLSEDLAEVKQHVISTETDLEEVTLHVKEGEENMVRLTKIVKRFEQKTLVDETDKQFSNMGFQNSGSTPVPPSTKAASHVFSVDTSQPPPRIQFRLPGLRPTVCYNCRRPGHIAKNCTKPNPRIFKLGDPEDGPQCVQNQNLSEPQNPPAQPKSILKKPVIQPPLSEPTKTQPPNTLREKYATNLSEIPAFKATKQPKVTGHKRLSDYNPEWVKSLIAQKSRQHKAKRPLWIF